MNCRHAALLQLLLPAACADAPAHAPKKEEPAVPPAEIFQKMERQLVESDSLRILSRYDQGVRDESGKEDRLSLSATCFLRGEAQCLVELRGVNREGRVVGAAMVSDGTRLYNRPQSTDPWSDSVVPDEFKAVFLPMLHRIGLAATTMTLTRWLARKEFNRPSVVPVPADFRSEETKDGVACMSYTLVDTAGKKYHAKLWYDAKTLQPLRRRSGVEDGKPGVFFDESYGDYALDARIPDGPFVLPDPDPAGRRRFASDGKSFLYEEREGGVVRFVLIADDGVEGETTPKGLVLRRGGVTKTIVSNTGLMLIKGNTTTMNAIPDGWNHDLVQEYHEYRAAHPKGTIIDWLKTSVKRRPAPMVEEYLRQE